MEKLSISIVDYCIRHAQIKREKREIYIYGFKLIIARNTGLVGRLAIMKNILCVLLCLTLLTLSSVSVSASELTDKQLSTLYDYGIFQGDESGNLNLDKNITRAEFCKVIMSSLGYSKEELNEFEETENFADVEKSHWAYLYIHNARKLSLIEGYENGCFLPESDINMTEVTKIIVALLGYKAEAEMLGGYPEGYLSVANNLGLTRDIEYAPNEAAVRKDVAAMIYNALNIPIMSATGHGDDKVYRLMNGANGTQLITWNRILKGEVAVIGLLQLLPVEDESDVPRFNGPEYTSRLIKISDLSKNLKGYTFKNSLNSDDISTYVVNDDTYVYISENTVKLEEIKNDMYAQCWYYTDDSDNIEILRIELLLNEPYMIESANTNEK